MRWSKTYIPTLRHRQSEAELESHQLLLRGGYIRRAGAGLYSFLPLMQRVVDRLERLVTAELESHGGLRISVPESESLPEGASGPLQSESGITSLIAGEVKSYRQMPLMMYRVGFGDNDESRPRQGLLHMRQPLTADVWCFDTGEEAARRSHELLIRAVKNLGRQLGLDLVVVEAASVDPDVLRAEDLVVLMDGPAGDRTELFCGKCDFAADLEIAAFKDIAGIAVDDAPESMKVVDTPGASTIEQVADLLDIPRTRLVKTIIVTADDTPVAALIRGDRDFNPTKLRGITGARTVAMADAEEVERCTRAPVGFAGPVGLRGMPVIADPLVAEMRNFVVGANSQDQHLVNVNIGRDFKPGQIADISMARESDGCPLCAEPLTGKNALVIGRFFCHDPRFSQAHNAVYLDSEGVSRPIFVSSVHIALTRALQTVVELSHDETGILWPAVLAPYQVEIVLLNPSRSDQSEAAERIYGELLAAGVGPILDDREERAGVKFHDADLVGAPVRLVVGDKSLREGKVEVGLRSERERRPVAVADAAEAVRKALETFN